MQLMLLLSTLLAYYANASNQLATDCTPRKLKVCRTVVWLVIRFLSLQEWEPPVEWTALSSSSEAPSAG